MIQDYKKQLETAENEKSEIITDYKKLVMVLQNEMDLAISEKNQEIEAYKMCLTEFEKEKEFVDTYFEKKIYYY